MHYRWTVYVPALYQVFPGCICVRPHFLPVGRHRGLLVIKLHNALGPDRQGNLPHRRSGLVVSGMYATGQVLGGGLHQFTLGL